MTITKEQLAATLESHAKWLRTRFSANTEGERAVLTGADLKGADLKGADLKGAVLTGAVLTGADLAGADLKGADLTGAVLTDADLTGADLTDADLTGADLTGADLRILKASPFVYDAIAAVQSARVALQKTRIEWLNR